MAGEKVVAASKFAVEARGREEKVALFKILKAEAQVVAGMNYRLRLEIRVDGLDRLPAIQGRGAIGAWTRSRS